MTYVEASFLSTLAAAAFIFATVIFFSFIFFFPDARESDVTKPSMNIKYG